MVQIRAEKVKAMFSKDCYFTLLSSIDREEGTKKEAISQHKHIRKLSYSWKIGHNNNNAYFVFC